MTFDSARALCRASVSGRGKRPGPDATGSPARVNERGSAVALPFMSALAERTGTEDDAQRAAEPDLFPGLSLSE
jgi:hypothetical protein